MRLSKTRIHAHDTEVLGLIYEYLECLSFTRVADAGGVVRFKRGMCHVSMRERSGYIVFRFTVKGKLGVADTRVLKFRFRDGTGPITRARVAVETIFAATQSIGG